MLLLFAPIFNQFPANNVLRKPTCLDGEFIEAAHPLSNLVISRKQSVKAFTSTCFPRCTARVDEPLSFQVVPVLTRQERYVDGDS